MDTNLSGSALGSEPYSCPFVVTLVRRYGLEHRTAFQADDAPGAFSDFQVVGD
jgi:hypothetical protein